MKERFEELSEALRQAKAVRRGEAAPSRVWSVTRGSNGQLHRRQLDPKEYQRGQRAEWEKTIAATRSRLRLSQNKFAEMLGISVKTLHNWEQGRAQADGRGAGAVAHGVTASRSGLGRSDGVKCGLILANF